MYELPSVTWQEGWIQPVPPLKVTGHAEAPEPNLEQCLYSQSAWLPAWAPHSMQGRVSRGLSFSHETTPQG